MRPLPDEAIAVLVEHPEGLPDLLLAVRILHLPRHHREELWEVDGAVTYNKKQARANIEIEFQLIQER